MDEPIMTDTLPKQKRVNRWFRGHIETIPFHYEIEGALEVIVQAMQARPWSFGLYDSFKFTIAPMHPERLEHEFSLSLNDADIKTSSAKGRLFQVSETTCIMEGTIEIVWQPLYKSALAGILFSGVVLLIGLAVGANALCVGAVVLVILYTLVGSHPTANQDRLVTILKGVADGIHSMRNPYKLVAESPYPKQSPKHSRPSSHREQIERSKPFIQKVDLRDTLEPDEKTKSKRG
jgi:hypothetical protein